MNTYGVLEVNAPLIFSIDTVCRCVLSLRLRLLDSDDRVSRYPFSRELGVFQSRPGCVAEDSAPYRYRESNPGHSSRIRPLASVAAHCPVITDGNIHPPVLYQIGSDKLVLENKNVDCSVLAL